MYNDEITVARASCYQFVMDGQGVRWSSLDPRLLRAALVRLLADRPLAAVSVAELCREAGVHRTTFYKHAAGVDEFAVTMLTEEIDAIAAIGVDIATEADAAAAEARTFRLMPEWWPGVH